MPQEEDKRPIEWVTPDIIRHHFNESQIFEKMKDGKYKTSLKRNSHPEKIPISEPYCTRSQIVFYIDQENGLIAVVHQYLRPDGKLGASGLPDPKRLFLKDRILSVITEIV